MSFNFEINRIKYDSIGEFKTPILKLNKKLI